MPDEVTCSLVDELLAKALKIAKPKFYYALSPCSVEAGYIAVDGVKFETAKTITTLLRRSESVAIFVATAGDEFQRWIDSVSESGDTLSLFVVDAVGSSLVEAVGDYMETILQSEIGTQKHTNRFSPGYCGWDIVEQHKLFALLPDGVCGVELTSTSLMHPIKSISGVIGIGDAVTTRKYGCAICSNKSCYLRKK